MLNARILMENIREDDPAHHFVGEVLKAAHEGLDLVESLLTLNRRDMQEKKPVVLPDVVRDAVSILRSTLPSSMILRQDIGTSRDLVLADPVQIKQVLIALADNARKTAREKGSLLSIGLDSRDLSAREAIKIDKSLAPGRYARITVRDNGGGVDEETLNRIFDPSLSTGGGKGMSLPVALGIVTGHKGSIKAASSPGRGSTFTVLLPVMESGSLL
jgi:signal transduction histidine kinase